MDIQLFWRGRPHTIGIGSQHLKNVVSRRQVGVAGKTAGATFYPVVVITEHPVAKRIGFRIAEFQGDKFERKGVLVVGNVKRLQHLCLSGRFERRVVGEDMGKLHLRFKWHIPDTVGVKDHHSAKPPRPYFSVSGQIKCSGIEFVAEQPVHRQIPDGIVPDGIITQQTLVAAQPQAPVPVGNYTVIRCIRKTIRGFVQNPGIQIPIDAQQTATSGDPQFLSVGAFEKNATIARAFDGLFQNQPAL